MNDYWSYDYSGTDSDQAAPVEGWPENAPVSDLVYALGAASQDCHLTGPGGMSDAAPVPAPSEVKRVDALAWQYHSGRWNDPDDGGTELTLYALIELVDGRWASLEGWNDYTGWGCQDGATMRIAATRDEAVNFGLTREARQVLFGVAS